MEEKVLIVLEKLGIGGVETFVLNQVKALIRKNVKVYVIAQNGIYTKKVQEMGATVINNKFNDCIYYDEKEIDKIVKIIEKNRITQVHINQFPAMNTVVPACLLTKTPYIVYLHMASGIIKSPQHNAYNYFENQYITYKNCFEMMFKHANKIVAITSTIKEYTAKRYNIDNKKIVVINNSIDVSEFSTKRKVNKIVNIFLISRLSREKQESILNGIKLYNQIKEKMDVNLTIAGDGPIRVEIEEYIYQNNIQDVKFLGSISNVKEEMDKYDAVIGVDRCILEALSLEKISIISGYDGLKGIVTQSNIDMCISENFCGKDLKNISVEKLKNQILQLDEKSIKEIVSSNYKIVKSKLDINKKVFYLKNEKLLISDTEIIKETFKMTKILGEYYQQYREKCDTLSYHNKELEKRLDKYDKNIIIKVLKKIYRILKYGMLKRKKGVHNE